MREYTFEYETEVQVTLIIKGTYSTGMPGIGRSMRDQGEPGARPFYEIASAVYEPDPYELARRAISVEDVAESLE